MIFFVFVAVVLVLGFSNVPFAIGAVIVLGVGLLYVVAGGRRG
jgi:hypothetical protein